MSDFSYWRLSSGSGSALGIGPQGLGNAQVEYSKLQAGLFVGSIKAKTAFITCIALNGELRVCVGCALLMGLLGLISVAGGPATNAAIVFRLVFYPYLGRRCSQLARSGH